jgi:hypothetical protein
MQVSLLFLFLYVFIAKTLQNYIRLLWFVQTYHVDFICSGQLDGFWEQEFADFALEFREVISRGDADDFLLYFAEHPVLETADMNELAAALTIAWVDQRVLFGTLFAKTNFTCACEVFFHFVCVSIKF